MISTLVVFCGILCSFGRVRWVGLGWVVDWAGWMDGWMECFRWTGLYCEKVGWDRLEWVFQTGLCKGGLGWDGPGWTVTGYVMMRWDGMGYMDRIGRTVDCDVMWWEDEIEVGEKMGEGEEVQGECCCLSFFFPGLSPSLSDLRFTISKSTIPVSVGR